MLKKLLLIVFVLIPFMVLANPIGDVDGNGKVGSADYALIKKHLLGQSLLTDDSLTRADVNNDGRVSSLDYVLIRKIIKNEENMPSITPSPTPVPTPTPVVTPRIMPTCTGTIARTGTKIIVDTNDNNITDIEWIINDKNIKGTNVYQEEKIINSAKVNVTINDQSYSINCSIKDNLIYHFKYDQKNERPYMPCDAYTAADRIKYEKMLKDAINEAGYGTRAGVVEAARFLVGVFDYKIAYQGPKSVNSEIGRYNKVGLNIGNSKAWGCRVSGYVQGIDCTNFIRWVFVQNGLSVAPYNAKHYSSNEMADKIRVGDFLYTPCKKNCLNSLKLEHVGIVIGVNDKYIYVAESMVGVSVVRYKKDNMPTSGKFSRVHFQEYAKEGNVTNMWLSE